MAYQLASSITSHENLLDQLATFLAGAGWTVDENTLGSGQRVIFVHTSYDSGIGAEDFYFALETTGTSGASWIQLSAATAYAPATARASQAGYSGQCRVSVKAGAMPRAWFHATAQYCHVFIEVSSGYIQALHFGCLDRGYAPTLGDKTGAFIFANREQTSSTYYWDSLTNLPVPDRIGIAAGRTKATTPDASFTETIACADGGRARYKHASADWTGNAGAGLHYETNCGAIYSAAANGPFNWCLSHEVLRYRCGDNSRPIFAIEIFVPNNPTTLPSHYLLGKIPGLRFFQFDGLQPAYEFDIASDAWQGFPVAFHNPSSLPISLAQVGLAVLKLI